MNELKQKLPLDIYNRLLSANCNSILNILTKNELQLANLLGVDGDSSAKNIIKEASFLTIGNKIKKFDEIPNWERVSTGCSSIDKITNGGIPLRAGITEIFGESGVGKTQFCIQLALTMQLSKRNTVYICTEDVFPIRRLKELSDIYQEQHGDINFLDNVYLNHITRFEQLRKLFAKLPIILGAANIGLIVIDSIAGLFRSDNENVDYKTRSKHFNYIALQLQQFSVDYNLAVVCINQVTDNIVSGKTEPCLGLAWSRLVMNRFKIARYGHSLEREFEIMYSPDLNCAKCNFIITRNGLE